MRRLRRWWRDDLMHWHSVCLTVYLFICLFDFALMPVVTEIVNLHTTPDRLITEAMRFSDPAAQIAALQLLHQQHSWQPLTLAESGLFHVAFGAILGVGAWSRGRPFSSYPTSPTAPEPLP